MSMYSCPGTDPRFAAFLARNDFRCPGCGYKLMGLQTSRCPDCSYRFDVAATLAAYRMPGILDLLRSRFGLALTLAINLAMLVGVHVGLPALVATQWDRNPPIEFYGLLAIRLAWFAVMVLGVGAWAVQLVSSALHGDDERRAMALGSWVAIGATLVHLSWVALRVGLA